MVPKAYMRRVSPPSRWPTERRQTERSLADPTGGRRASPRARRTQALQSELPGSEARAAVGCERKVRPARMTPEQRVRAVELLGDGATIRETAALVKLT